MITHTKTNRGAQTNRGVGWLAIAIAVLVLPQLSFCGELLAEDVLTFHNTTDATLNLRVQASEATMVARSTIPPNSARSFRLPAGYHTVRTWPRFGAQWGDEDYKENKQRIHVVEGKRLSHTLEVGARDFGKFLLADPPSVTRFVGVWNWEEGGPQTDMLNVSADATFTCGATQGTWSFVDGKLTMDWSPDDPQGAQAVVETRTIAGVASLTGKYWPDAASPGVGIAATKLVGETAGPTDPEGNTHVPPRSAEDLAALKGCDFILHEGTWANQLYRGRDGKYWFSITQWNQYMTREGGVWRRYYTNDPVNHRVEYRFKGTIKDKDEQVLGWTYDAYNPNGDHLGVARLMKP